jgi:hypothetical protein
MSNNVNRWQRVNFADSSGPGWRYGLLEVATFYCSVILNWAFASGVVGAFCPARDIVPRDNRKRIETR